MDRRALGVGRKRDAKPVRRPARRLGLEIGERRQRILARALDGVDAKVERRARRQRRALLGPLVAEHCGEIRIEPFGIIAEHVRRRVGHVGRRELAALRIGQGRQRIARTVDEARHRLDIEAALAHQHAEHRAARAVVAHHEGGRGASAQRVVDQPGNGGAVAGTGEAVRQAPILQRIGRGPSPRLDVGEDLDCRREFCSGRHGASSHGSPSMILTMKISHMIRSTSAETT